MKDLPLLVLRVGLDRRYQECLTIEPSFDLVVALHDYIQYINDHPTLDYLFTKKLQANARTLSNQIKEEGIKAEKELEIVFKKLEILVQKKKIDDVRVKSALSNYKDFRDGRVISSLGRAESMSQELRDVINDLYNTVDKDLVVEFIVQNRARTGILRFNLGRAIQLHELYKNRFKKLSEVSAWGAFDIIFISYRAIKSYTDDYTEDQNNIPWLNDSRFIASAVQALADEKSGLTYQQSDHSAKPVFFRDYSKAVLARLHLALLDELDKYEQLKSKPALKKETAGLEPSAVIKVNPDVAPEVIDDSGYGFFKFNKNSARIRIGKSSTRTFRLVKALIYPLGTAKITDSVFEEIRLAKDANDERLNNPVTRRQRQVDIITWTIKELQKIEELQGRFRVQFTPNNQHAVYLEVF